MLTLISDIIVPFAVTISLIGLATVHQLVERLA